MAVFLVVGTRPQIIKSIPILSQAEKQGLTIKLIHTGQHYDYNLSQVFFNEMAAPAPYANLNVGSGSHIFQISEIMLQLENLFAKERPELVIVPGDTNSALAGALASVKLGIPVAHIESGARSYDMQMAEEVNRRIIDHCGTLLFAPTEICQKNLNDESVQGQVFLTGDSMFDAFSEFTSKPLPDVCTDLGLKGKEYCILTTHRAENVDNPAKLRNLLQILENINMPIVFPIHPRTKKQLAENGFSIENKNVMPIAPLGYLEMLSLLKSSKLVVTDSGGLQKEAFWSQVPCITIRDRTEWMETVNMGVNFVVDVDPEKLAAAVNYVLTNYIEIKKKFVRNPYSNGSASLKIVEIIKIKVGK